MNLSDNTTINTYIHTLHTYIDLPLEVDDVWAYDENEAVPASAPELLCKEHSPSKTQISFPVLLYQESLSLVFLS